MTTELKDASLPDGTKAKVLTQPQIEVLLEMIEDRLWWHGAKKRIAHMSKWATWTAGFLIALSLWWPWLSRMVALVIEGVPT